MICCHFIFKPATYDDEFQSVALLARFPQDGEAKDKEQRWYDGYRIVISQVRAT